MPLIWKLALSVLPELVKIFWQAYKDVKKKKRTVEQVQKLMKDVEYAFKNPNKIDGSQSISSMFNNLLQ